MSFSIFAVVMILIILLVAFFHYVQGFFSATISAVLCIIAAVLAVSYHEVIVRAYLGGRMADMADSMVLVVLFAALYLIPRVMFDNFVPGNVRVPAIVDKIGGAVMGLIAGIFAAGVMAIAAQEMPFYPAIAGYARYDVQSKSEIGVPSTRGRNVDRDLIDVLNVEGLEDPNRRLNQGLSPNTLIIPVDDIVLGTVRRLSDGGPMSGRPLSQVHPNWLLELFGQRMGIQPSAKRVAMILPSKGIKDVSLNGVYALDAASLVQKEGEVSVARNIKQKLPIKFEDKNRILVAVRIFFNISAKDLDNLIRFSPGSIRLVTRMRTGGQERFVDYYPIGTLDDAHTLYVSQMDDFLFLSERNNGKETFNDQGVDLVFYVDRNGFVVDGGNGQEKITPGTFLEVKRMADIDLAGQDVKRGIKADPDVNVLRKRAVSGADAAGATSDSGQGTPAPAPTPPAKTGSTAPPTGTPARTPPTPSPATASGDERLIGTWIAVPDANANAAVKSSLIFSPTEVSSVESNAFFSKTMQGTWKQTQSNGGSVTVHRDLKDSKGQSISDDLTISFVGNDRISVVSSTAPEKPTVYVKK